MQLVRRNILVKAKAGSHLFGTDTATSDQDFKGVYLPSLEDCITGNVIHTIKHSTNNVVGQRNNQHDLDIEYHSAQKFFKMLEEGQTVAIELLFSPENMIEEKSKQWDFIVANRDKLIHKQIKAFIGYARQQGTKYGLIGSRMNELQRMIVLLDTINGNERIYTVKDEILFSMPTNYCKFETVINKGEQHDYLTVLGKKYSVRTFVKDLKASLIDTDSKYGTRAKAAQRNEGIDYKALSHGVRCCYQGIELLTTGKIEFPLKQREELLAIKQGKFTFNELDAKLILLFDELNKAYLTSTLPETIDTKPFLLELYGNIYNL